MEDLSDLGGRGRLGAARRLAAPSFPSSSSKVSVQVYTVPSSSTAGGEAARAQGGVAPMIHASSSSVSGHGGRAADLDLIKANIVSHPRYHRLLAAFLDCHKARAWTCSFLLHRAAAVFRIHSCCIRVHVTQVGCPPEAAEEIATAAREREAWQRAAVGDAHNTRPDPELDQFMVEYQTSMHACTR